MQAWPLRKMNPAPWRLCRVVSREQGSLSWPLNWEEGEDPRFLVTSVIILRQGERSSGIDRSRYFNLHLRRAVDPDLAGGAVRGLRRDDLGQRDVLAGGVSASSSARSSPCRPSDGFPVLLMA